MADSQIMKTIRDAIEAVLPDLPHDVIKLLENTLEALGVLTTDDLPYIKESDLNPVVKPIQARRLVAAWTQNVSTTSTPVMCSSPVSVLYSSPSSSVNHSPASSAIGSPPSSSAAFQTEDVIEHIKSTFYTQCKEINKGTSIETLCREWPFLFIQAGMAEHFQQLTGVSLTGSFHENVDKKGERLLNFLKTGDSRKHKPVLNALLKLQAERNQSSGCSEEVIEMVLLMAHFGENEAHLFHCVEETSLAKEVQMKDVPLTPCLIVCGSSCFVAKTFMLSIDQKVVNDHITSFSSAMCLLFGSYYCFNIHYPVELRSTLEFLQRCFFSINPERGTKVEQKKKKLFSVNPRVLTLISALADHEWI
ncbi:hypothetical protein JOB18_019490 [Solea senegalensis]|nr:uncharacterized protein LOC122762613 [Solea senegalensis]XP_043874451.1 uncharacterized protein LOC122764212 [Solea senegalensis]XP_043874510.1 uncharacterized protein LOC122764440 [Solea senegalensis]KAG7462258.1 hypothetical protein JOB18_019490 [Solea senegalensis]